MTTHYIRIRCLILNHRIEHKLIIYSNLQLLEFHNNHSFRWNTIDDCS